MKVAVIGGGIQGVALALEFAARGVRVELLEARDQLLLGASRENEGKIHLGFVYANDATLTTARLMSRGAFAFAPCLYRWLEQDVAGLLISRPFTYVVHRDSLLDPERLTERYTAIGREIDEASQIPGADYFGRDNLHRMRRLSDREIAGRFDTSTVAAAFESSEIAVDPDVVATLLAERVLSDSRIRVRTGTRVIAAERVFGGVGLTLEPGAGSSEQFTERYDHVFNCAWCGRLAIDATLGSVPTRAWSFRRKHFLRVPAGIVHEPLDSTTIVLGAFGDVVQYASGELFLSWYPAGCEGIETGLAPRPAEGTLAAAQRGGVGAAIVRELGRIVPALRGAAAEIAARSTLRNGVIFALGATDIDDTQSLLHRRYEVGVRSFGNYHTIDTGKYTLAPLFARELAERVTPMRKAA